MSSLLHRKSRSRSIVSLIEAGTTLMGPITGRRSHINKVDEAHESVSSDFDSHSMASRDHYYKSKEAKYSSLDYRDVRKNGNYSDILRRNKNITANEPQRLVSSSFKEEQNLRSKPPINSVTSKKKNPSSSSSSNETTNRGGATLKKLFKDIKPSFSFEKDSSDTFDRSWLTNLMPYIFKFMEWTFIFVLVFFDFSIAYILLCFLIYAYQIHNSERTRKLALFGKISTEEFISHIDKESFPAWLKSSDMDRAEWINDIIAQLWPNLNRYATRFITTFIEPELISILNELQLKDLSGFEIKKVILGQIPLKIGGCKVFPRGSKSENEGIMLEMELIYSGDARVQFIVQRIAAEIKNISLRGTVRIYLKPLLNTFPLIGGCEITFMQLPIYSYSLGGIGTFADLPGISTLIKSIVDSQIKSRVLWPNKLKIIIPIPETEEAILKQKSFISRPYGYLHIQVLEAENLVAKDINMVGKGSSDPYVIVVVNGKKVSFQSQYVEKNLNPIWNYDCNFILDGDLIPEDHNCEILVYDYDQGTQDDFMGNAIINLQCVFNNLEFNNWVPLTNIKKGKIHLKMKFRECTPLLSTSGDYILHIFIESCSHLIDESNQAVLGSIQCSVNNNAFILSQKGKTNPEDGIHFINDGATFYTSIENEFIITVSDSKNIFKEFGECRLSIADMINNFDGEITNEVLPLNFHSDSNINLSARLYSLSD